MDDKERDRFAVELLDAALRRYRSLEPRPGLEERVLASLRARRRAGPWLGWKGLAWAVPAAVLATVALALYLNRRTVPFSGPPPRSIAVRKPEPPAAAVSQGATRPHSHVPQSRVARPQPARREQFPTQAPLSEQEKLLLLYVNQAPGPLLIAQTDSDALQDLKIEDLHISELELEPSPEDELTK